MVEEDTLKTIKTIMSAFESSKHAKGYNITLKS